MIEFPLTCDVGGLSREELRERLGARGIELNDHAVTLLEQSVFEQREPEVLTVVQRTPAELGLAEGGTLPQVIVAARQAGFGLCPPDAGPYLRLAMGSQEQAPDSVLSAGRAPTGALHVLSEPLRADHAFPKGFYLRVVDGVEWLRGYRCDDEYVVPSTSRFVLRQRDPLDPQ